MRPGRPTVYLAPTLSWVSCQGIIDKACEIRHPDGRELVLDTLEARVDLINPSNPFKRVTGGYIKAKWHLAKTLFTWKIHRLQVCPDFSSTTQRSGMRTHRRFHLRRTSS